MPVLCDRPDVIVLTDEAHRSQYDTLALNMRAALSKALFLAFTGTPLIAGEERTNPGYREVRLTPPRLISGTSAACLGARVVCSNPSLGDARRLESAI